MDKTPKHRTMPTLSVLLLASVLLLSVGRIAQYLPYNAASSIAAGLKGTWLGYTADTKELTKITTSSSSYDCAHNYSINIMSFDPVVLYLENFIKEEEIEHLLHVT